MRKNKAGLQRNGMRMMVLDDDPSITLALQAYFEASGYRVDTENNPERALQAMRDTRYDILLLDFLMEPICGDEVVERLRAFDSDIYILLLTGHMELAPPLNTLRELDIQGYYEKSDRFDQLELLVESCVKSIRQMRVIRDYRDGLKRVLDMNPRLNVLAPLKETMRTALSLVGELTHAPGALIYLEQWDGKSAGYAGLGPYDTESEQFEQTLYPALKDAAARAKSLGVPVEENGFLIAPLTLSETLCGYLVVDALGFKDDSSRQIIGVMSQQVASAIKNAILHEELQEKNEQLTDAYKKLKDGYIGTIEALRLRVDAKDFYTRGHSDRVAYYAVRLAREAGMDETTVERIRVSALFHDVGKLSVPDAVLSKAGRLDGEELKSIRAHPAMSEKIISRLTFFDGIARMVGAHHERVDGTGYPRGLKGDEIPLEARVLALADAFDAMTSDRRYRGKLTMDEAITELQKCRGTQFDAALDDVFIRLAREHFDEMAKELEWTYLGVGREE